MKMKKWLIALLAVCMMAVFIPASQARAEESVPIDAAHFPDKKFRACVTNYDTDGDGALSEAEIGQVTEMNISDKKISDLTGIAYFYALTDLNCSFNQLTMLDVSQNTVLTILRCASNQLTTLNVSQNPALTDLNCSSNQLTWLDVSQTSALTELYCDSNQLTTLDVSQCPQLTAYINENKYGEYQIYAGYGSRYSNIRFDIGVNLITEQ